MTKTTCDSCGKQIDRLHVVVLPVRTESHGQAPDGYRFLIFRDLSCAQGEWVQTDRCYGCCFEEFKSKEWKRTV